MFRPRYETEDLLLFITKNCVGLIGQTHKKPRETFEFKPTQPGEFFSFLPPISIDGFWMTGLTGLEVYNSILNISQESIRFKIVTFPYPKKGGTSYE